jgi:shikimate dehydrogenase
MNVYGLIGFPLTHSFSKRYFTEKFEKEGIPNSTYELFEIREATALPSVISSQPQLRGLNVTIPHKEAVIPLLDELDPAAEKIGAVNVIKVTEGNKLKGYNSDYYGFRNSLLKFLGEANPAILKALILGTGGAAKAVIAALDNLAIPYKLVSRSGEAPILRYEELNASLLDEYRLIINTSPLGMYPKTDTCPAIPYEYLTEKHYLFDLVYNPEETLFMKKGAERGAKTKNGLEMLHLQAEKAWEIWNS